MTTTNPTITVTARDVQIGPMPDGTTWSLAEDGGMPHDGSFPEPLLVRIAVSRLREWIRTERPMWDLAVS